MEKNPRKTRVKTFHKTLVDTAGTNNGTVDITVTTRLNVNLTEADILNWIQNCGDTGALKRIENRTALRRIHLIENHSNLHNRE